MDYRVAIVGATGLRGQEVGAILRYRDFPSRGVRLLDVEPAERTARKLTAFDEEPALVDPITPEQFDGVDVAFFAGPAEQTQRYWREALSRGCLVIDLSSALDREPQAEIVGPMLGDELAEGRMPRVVVIAHPSAQVIARLLHSLTRVAAIELACATVFEPASERGRAGVQELQQQTLNLFSFKPLPTEVYDGQVAFNLRVALGTASEPGLASIQQRVQYHLEHLGARDGARYFPMPALQLVQAPLFHAQVVALFVQLAESVEAERLDRALATSDVRSYSAEAPPDALQAAGEDRIQLAAVRRDQSLARGYWLFASVDNLRITALAAVDAASALLRTRRVA